MAANKPTLSRRVLRVLHWLRDAEEVNIERVQKAFDLCDKQARTTLKLLVDEGWAVKTRRGRHAEFSLRTVGSGKQLEVATAASLGFAVAALDTLAGTAFHDQARAAVDAYRASVAETKSVEVARLLSAFHPLVASRPRSLKHAEFAEEILDALRMGHVIEGRYERLVDGKVDRYRLRPLTLVVDQHGLHLVAKKRDGKVRMFDVEGFQSLKRIRPRKNAGPAMFKAKAYFKGAFGRYTDFKVIDVELRLTGSAGRIVERRSFHHSQKSQRRADGVRVTMRVGDCPEFRSWLLGMAPDVEVLAPSGLRSDIAAAMEAGAERNR